MSPEYIIFIHIYIYSLTAVAVRVLVGFNRVQHPYSDRAVAVRVGRGRSFLPVLVVPIRCASFLQY